MTDTSENGGTHVRIYLHNGNHWDLMLEDERPVRDAVRRYLDDETKDELIETTLIGGDDMGILASMIHTILRSTPGGRRGELERIGRMHREQEALSKEFGLNAPGEPWEQGG